MQHNQPSRHARQTCLLIALLLISPPAAVSKSSPPHHKKRDEFPGKGSRKRWIEACAKYNRGVARAKERNFDEAACDFKQAIKIYPYDFSFHENLGAALRELKKLDEAESSTRTAAALSPHRWGPWRNLAVILAQEHKYAQAQEALKKALSLHPPPASRSELQKLSTALESACEKP